jgi:hypothetical protein
LVTGCLLIPAPSRSLGPTVPKSTQRIPRIPAIAANNAALTSPPFFGPLRWSHVTGSYVETNSPWPERLRDGLELCGCADYSFELVRQCVRTREGFR